jgi:hypothetical protein
MRVALPNAPPATGLVAEALAQEQARGEERGASAVNPRPMARKGHFTKEFFRTQLEEAKTQLQQLEATNSDPSGALAKTLREQIDRQRKAMANAPDRPSLFEVFA